MKFDVYCDESSPEAIASENSDNKFLMIGSLWLPRDKRTQFKDAIHKLRNKHKVGGEFKWNRISPSRLEFYCELIEMFFSKEDDLRFRCIAVDCDKVNLTKFHANDQELGFYKFYYQLLHHWVLDFNEYAFYLDYKKNRKRDRLHVLRDCLDDSNLSSLVTTVQATESSQSVLIQLADVLTGCASRRFNNTSTESAAKNQVLQTVEEKLGREIGPTTRHVKKFNVFRINLSGGW
jgi:hypothetical protein